MNIIEIYNEYKKPIIIIIIVIIFLLVLWGIDNIKTKEDKIKDYIIYKDFIIDKDKTLYQKRISELTKDDYDENVKNKIDSTFDMLYFNIYSYTLTETLYNYKNDVESFLSANYDYKNDKIVYNYQITYETANIIFRGSYNKNKFKCESEYAFDAYIEGTEKEYCDIIKEEIKSFKDKATETITSTKILKYMKD